MLSSTYKKHETLAQEQIYVSFCIEFIIIIN